MKELKPCPFCGSEYQTIEDLGLKPASECHGGKHWYVINCLDCGGFDARFRAKGNDNRLE